MMAMPLKRRRVSGGRPRLAVTVAMPRLSDRRRSSGHQDDDEYTSAAVTRKRHLDERVVGRACDGMDDGWMDGRMDGWMDGWMD